MTTRARIHALIGASLAAACNIREPRVTGTFAAPCSLSAQCGRDSVCFLGECRPSSSQLSVVSAEVRAPADQQLGGLQRAGIDLRKSPLVDFQLLPQLTATGSVVQTLDAGGTAPVSGANVLLSIAAPAIADRASNVSARTDPSGAFSLVFASSTWNVLVLPPPSAGPPLRRPPLDPPASGTAVDLQIIQLPRPAALTRVTGTLFAGGPNNRLAGAMVTAVDGKGQALSAPEKTDLQGVFNLLLPPATASYLLQVGPDSTAPATEPPVPAFTPRSLSGTTLDVGPLPAPATLTGRVLDARGQAVPLARVAALSTDPAGWVISREATTDATGAFALSLRAGAYVLEAAPDPDPSLPGLSGEVPVTLDAGGRSVVLTCPDKRKAEGVVLRPDGLRAGAGYQIIATRLPDGLITGRLARTTSTDSIGSFAVVSDGGHYRLEIVPPVESGLPRKIVTVDLSVPGALPSPLQLSPALIVVGTISKPGAPVSFATVEFFALDASGHRSVLIGSVLSDSAGVYRAALPDVAAPAN